jgi:hypothetical protein
MSEEEKKEVEKPKAVVIRYHRARHYRTIHADGAWAGITPQLEIQFALFTDLRPMPDYVMHNITEDSGLGEEIDRKVPQGLIREAEVNIVMNVLTVEQLIDLLQRMVDQVKALPAMATAIAAAQGSAEDKSSEVK